MAGGRSHGRQTSENFRAVDRRSYRQRRVPRGAANLLRRRDGLILRRGPGDARSQGRRRRRALSRGLQPASLLCDQIFSRWEAAGKILHPYEQGRTRQLGVTVAPEVSSPAEGSIIKTERLGVLH